MSCKRLYNLRNTVRVVFTALSTLAFDCIGAFILPPPLVYTAEFLPQAKLNTSYAERIYIMKNIHTLLSEIGITIPDEKKAEFDKAVLANYKTFAEVEKITTARDNYKSQLETAQTALKEFEGVDVENLKSEIAKLNISLKDKETEYQTKIRRNYRLYAYCNYLNKIYAPKVEKLIRSVII